MGVRFPGLREHQETQELDTDRDVERIMGPLASNMQEQKELRRQMLRTPDLRAIFEVRIQVRGIVIQVGSGRREIVIQVLEFVRKYAVSATRGGFLSIKSIGCRRSAGLDIDLGELVNIWFRRMSNSTVLNEVARANKRPDPIDRECLARSHLKSTGWPSLHRRRNLV